MSVFNSIRSLPTEQITPESFRAYGQVIFPSKDGKLFDETEAQLQLANGIPRFYIMRLTKNGRYFDRITRHSQCTQCLGSLDGKDWFMAVAPPSQSDQPDLHQLRAFRIPGSCFIKLEVGTWHAGPHFDWEFIDFYNLELSDTNITDHFTYNFSKNDRISFEIT